ncbi:MAG: sugar ABC transporter ATP-binding protein [Synergistaceae bacterium]|jgi:ribose transport system ATP-binding protein|nr:sugar ABC transporter ATP-binding protein [Synergistaceae bacterium]
MSDILLSVRNISKSFPGTQALKDVSINFRRGEVHALVGENGAGKSTLMNIVSGVMRPDSGSVLFEGGAVNFSGAEDALKLGISYVHQEKVLCPHISVAENLFLGQTIKNRFGFFDYGTIYKKARDILDLFASDIDPAARVDSLNVSQRQIIEISRAIARDCNVLILDEPTSSLMEKEVNLLFKIVKELKNKSITVIYITHRMNEIFSICDRFSVLRDGSLIVTDDVAGADAKRVISFMVGRDIEDSHPEKADRIGEVVLEVKGLALKPAFEDVSFKLRKGEILGFAGLMGSGRSELAKAICGAYKRDSGGVFLDGHEVKASNYHESLALGIAYLTEDRKEEGLFLNLSVQNNICAACVSSISKGGVFLDLCKESETASEYIHELKIVTSGLNTPITALSGGNQQKVMIAKVLSTKPKVIFFDEPTRGIDVVAKMEIHKQMLSLAREGIAVVLISSEMPEIIGISNRILVMHEGRVRGELQRDEINETNIMALASGHDIQG